MVYLAFTRGSSDGPRHIHGRGRRSPHGRGRARGRDRRSHTWRPGLRDLARKESIHDVVAIACRTGIDIDTGLSESVNSPATNTAANKHVNASCRKHASESAMTGTV